MGSTLGDRTTLQLPAALLLPGPVEGVPALEELERLTAVPDRRVVYRNVGWRFYERCVDKVPESAGIHVDYDGKDLEVMGKGWKHEWVRGLLRRLVDAISEELGIPCNSVGETTWKRRRAGPRTRGRRVLLLPAGKTGCRRGGARAGLATILRTIPAPTWRSRSTFRLRRLIALGFMRRSGSPRSGGLSGTLW